MIRSSAFRPAWWLPGPHLQTLWPNLVRRRLPVPGRSERWKLPDGDFLDLFHADCPAPRGQALLLHGLEGSFDSRYIRGLMRHLAARRIAPTLMHFRGCSGEPNRLPRSYHSGETEDLGAACAELRRRRPALPLFVAGFSLGGNVLLKWLGEAAERAGVGAAVAVSVPLVLDAAAWRLERGFSRLYQAALLRGLKRSYARKAARMPLTPPVARVAGSRSFREFDDLVTAPLHGFADAADYYARSSSRQYLRFIRTPTLIIQARDDPFMTEAVLPDASELSPAVTLELADSGGHVGFVAGAIPGFARYWLEERIGNFFLESLGSGKS